MNQEDDTLLRMEITTHAHMHKLNDKYNQKMVLNRSKWQNPDIASSHGIIHAHQGNPLLQEQDQHTYECQNQLTPNIYTKDPIRRIWRGSSWSAPISSTVR